MQDATDVHYQRLGSLLFNTHGFLGNIRKVTQQALRHPIVETKNSAGVVMERFKADGRRGFGRTATDAILFASYPSPLLNTRDNFPH
jgi:hypothetical protein